SKVRKRKIGLHGLLLFSSNEGVAFFKSLGRGKGLIAIFIDHKVASKNVCSHLIVEMLLYISPFHPERGVSRFGGCDRCALVIDYDFLDLMRSYFFVALVSWHCCCVIHCHLLCI